MIDDGGYVTTELPRPSGSVLLVDDEPEILATLSAILTARGFRVRTASDASAAIRIMDEMRDTGLDVIVTDILLPGASGVDLLAAVRDRSSTVAVVLMSGAPSVDTAAAALRLGAFDYLTKPVSGTQLVDLLRRAVSTRLAAKAAQRDKAAVSAELIELRSAVEARTRELDESHHERYRQLVESLDVLVFELDLPTVRFTHLGGALAPLFVDPNDPDRARVSPMSIIHADDLDRVKRLVEAWSVASGELREPEEFRLIAVDGTVRWVRCIPSRTAHGTPPRLVSGVFVDVTAMRVMEERRAALEIELTSARQELDRRLLRDLEPASQAHRVRATQSASDADETPEFGLSPAMARTRAAALLAAEHDEPVLLTGETGTGKGVLADFVHRRSSRAKCAFVSLNCASLRGDLLASELFGHTKGAFTSADRHRKGLIEEAEGGTLFLDELGEMGLEVQGQLLKVLEEKTYRRVGETQQRRSNFRLICATHRDLHRMADAGGFRKDLLYRIDVFRVAVPALRDRREDIVPLARRLLAGAGAGGVQFAEETESFLASLPWPGNVRELRSALFRASLLARGQRLRPEHFEDFLSYDDRGPPSGQFTTPPTGELRPPPSDANKLDDDSPLERERIEALLRRFDGNRAKVARELGVARSTLYRKLDRMGL